MGGILQALGDPAIRGWYLAFCMALLVLPMAGLAWWYHARIKATPGGRRLMQRQGRSRPAPRGGPVQTARGLVEGVGMARDIAAGRYGATAKAMQVRVYWVTGLWLLANALAFGLLIWADEVNRVGG